MSISQTEHAERAAHLRTEYRIQRLIDERLDKEIIEQMQRLVEETQLCNNRQLGRAQFSALQNIARETTSIQVILTWILFQTGRLQGWRNEQFGQKLHATLQSFRPIAEEIAKEAVKGIPGQKPDDYVRQVWLRLIQQYVGQLQRQVVACQGQEGR